MVSDNARTIELAIEPKGLTMDPRLSGQEQDALRKLASLGTVYHLLRSDQATLEACGLVERNGDGGALLTDQGRRYLVLLGQGPCMLACPDKR